MTKPDLYWRRKIKRAKAMSPGRERDAALVLAYNGSTRAFLRRFGRVMYDRVIEAALSAQSTLEALSEAMARQRNEGIL